MEELETEAVIKRDRERLTKAREEAEQRIQAAQQELADIERRFKAIEAFEAALRNGRNEQEPASPVRRRRPKKSPPKAERASRGERQQHTEDRHAQVERLHGGRHQAQRGRADKQPARLAG